MTCDGCVFIKKLRVELYAWTLTIIRFSGASVKIVSLEADKTLEQQTERIVTIVGTPESQWKAQYLMRKDGFVSGTDDVRFTVEILVPSAQVSVSHDMARLPVPRRS